MDNRILSKEQMEEHLIRKLQERLQKVIWGVNAWSPSDVLKFTTEAMMEKVWNEKQKKAFKEYLFTEGFKTRFEGQKRDELNLLPLTWYFPVEGKESSKLQHLRQEYKDSFRVTYDAFVKKAEEELRNFFEEQCNITVVKIENPLYRTIFLQVLQDNPFFVLEEANKESEENVSLRRQSAREEQLVKAVLGKNADVQEGSDFTESHNEKAKANKEASKAVEFCKSNKGKVKIYSHITSHGDWIILSKNNKFYSLPHEYEERYNQNLQRYAEDFLKQLNFEMNLYYKRKTKKMLLENEEPSHQFVYYLPIYVLKEFIHTFEPLGFKISYFPDTYRQDYTPLSVEIPSYVELFITINVPKKHDNLGLGTIVNEEYRRFYRIYG